MNGNNQISVLNFDHTYENQPFLQNRYMDWIDFTHLTGVMKFCEQKSLTKIQKQLSRRKNKKITLIGSGDYHYISLLLMKEIQTPFSLILFDNHPDCKKPLFSNLISCGSWVLKAIEQLHMLEKVIIIGTSKKHLVDIPESMTKKISFFPFHYFSHFHVTEILHLITETIPTMNIHISIDKDVLSRTYAYTNWDHGQLSLQDLINVIQHVSKNHQVLSADVCGEYPFSPLNHEQATKEKIILNSNSNKLIVHTLLTLMSKEKVFIDH